MINVTCKTKKIGIIGWPLGHAASPRIHNAAFAAGELDFIYLGLPVAPENIKDAVSGLKALGFVGANVTIPHKVAIIPFLDCLDDSAKLVGAVNTIVIKDGKSIGYNTDLDGFMQSLWNKNINVAGKKVVVFGSGGGCRAVVAAFLKHGAAHIFVLARNGLKAAEMANLFFDIDETETPVTGCDWAEDACSGILAGADILVNATPLGMSPDCESMPPVRWDAVNQAAVFVDLVYNPQVTRFMQEALERGHKAVGGEGMLIEQAVLAFSLWTGEKAPKDIMLQAFGAINF